MRRTRIKFCGMTRAEDIDAAIELGVDAIGLILTAHSPRRLDLDAARDLRRRIPSGVTAVALVMDPDHSEVERMIEQVRPDCLQFHGRETAEFCAAFGLPYLKAIAMAEPASALASMNEHLAAAAWVLDSHRPGAAGGRGAVFDWAAVPSNCQRPVFVAGGLGPANVAEAIGLLRPYAVDVASGIESAPGIKSPAAMRDFVAAVRRADRALLSEETPP